MTVKRLSGQTSPASAPWKVQTALNDTGHIVTTMSGIADASFAETIRRQLLPKTSARASVDWIADASEVTSFNATVMKPAAELLYDFRKAGGRHVVAIITNGSVRMAAATISMSSRILGGPSIEIVQSMPEALKRLRELETGST